jgi:hypothetical protein
MRITYSDVRTAGLTPKGAIALNSYQFRLLGIAWPPKPGWINKLLVKQIEDELWQLVMDLKGIKTKNERRRILKQYGCKARALFQGQYDRGLNPPPPPELPTCVDSYEI